MVYFYVLELEKYVFITYKLKNVLILTYYVILFLILMFHFINYFSYLLEPKSETMVCCLPSYNNNCIN